jgi:hypothetical protein
MLREKEIRDNPQTFIKWMCFDCFITSDKQVVNLSFILRKEMLVGGSYGYLCNGKFRTKKWINEHCVNVLGLICND